MSLVYAAPKGEKKVSLVSLKNARVSHDKSRIGGPSKASTYLSKGSKRERERDEERKKVESSVEMIRDKRGMRGDAAQLQRASGTLPDDESNFHLFHKLYMKGGGGSPSPLFQ